MYRALNSLNSGVVGMLAVTASGLIVALVCDAVILASPQMLRAMGPLSIYLPWGVFAIGLSAFVVQLTARAHSSIPNYLSLFGEVLGGGRRVLIWQAIAVALLLLAFQVPIFAAWVGVEPDIGAAERTSVGGVLPMSGAHQLYHAADIMAMYGEMTPQGARRPMHPPFLANLWILANFDVRWMFLLQGAAVGLAAAPFLRVFAQIVGFGAAIVTGGLLLAMVYWAMPSAMSAPPGLFYGLCATTITLVAFLRRDARWLAVASGVLLIGFAARAGAYLVVPALIVIGVGTSIAYGQSLKRYFAYAVVAVVLGLGTPQAMLFVYGGRTTTFQGNFSHVLYMLASGSTDWRQAKVDLGDIYEGNSLSDWYSFVYEKAFGKMQKNPWVFVVTATDIMGTAIVKQPAKIADHILAISHIRKINILPEWIGLASLFTALYIIGLARVFLMRTHSGIKIAFAVVLVSYFFSMPFTWLTGALRYHAVTWTLPAGICSLSIMLVPKSVANATGPVDGASRRMAFGALGLVCAVVLAGFVLPRFVGPSVFGVSAGTEFTKVKAGNGHRTFLTLGSHIPYLRLVPDQEIQPLRPAIGESEIRNHWYLQKWPNAFGNLQSGQQVSAIVESGQRHRTYYLISETFCMPAKRQLFEARVERKDDTNASVMVLRALEPVGDAPPTRTASGLPDYCARLQTDNQ